MNSLLLTGGMVVLGTAYPPGNQTALRE